MNGITELRAHLFDTLRCLQDKTNPMDIDRAKAVSEVAKTLIDSARVEVDFIRATGGTFGTGFITLENSNRDKPWGPVESQSLADRSKGTSTTVNGAVTRHVAK